MKTFFMVTLLLFVACHTFAQWNPENQTTGNIYHTGGYVGIGTGLPDAPLHISGSVPELNLLIHNTSTNGARTFLSALPGKSSIQTDKDFTIATNYDGWNDRFILTHSGKVGIGLLQPQEKLQIDGTLGIGKMSNALYTGLRIEYIDGGSGTTVFKHLRWGGDVYFKRESASGERTQFYFGGSGSHRMDIYDDNNEVLVRLHAHGDSYLNGGKVGIGTTSPSEKLTVNGTVYSTEVKVDVNAGTGPDYVFEPDYNLSTLSEIETYIKANKHLPEVPSAKEMETNGINLSEMNMLLLRKIEELTLHIIDQGKLIEKLQEPHTSADISAKKVEELTLHLIRIEKENELQRKEINELKNKRKK